MTRLGIWDLHTGALIPPPRGAAPLAGTIRDVAFATYWNRQTLFCLVLERFGYATHEINLETGKLASLPSRVSADEVRGLVLAPDARRILVVAESALGLIDRVRGTHRPIAPPCTPVPTRVAVEWLERGLRVYWLRHDAAGATATLVRQEIARVPTTTVVARGALSAAALSPTGARWALAEGPLVRLPERFELESLDDAPARPRARRR